MSTDGDAWSAPATGEAAPPPPLPPLWRRVVDVILSPGRLMEAVAREPRWLGAFLLGSALVALAGWLIPVEVYRESFRAMSLESGNEIPPSAAEFARTLGLVFSPIGWAIWTFLTAGMATVAFAFVFGDEGTFKQYLAATAHSLLIPALGGLVTVPLRIAAGDFRMTLSVGSVLSGVLSPGYLLNVLRGLDLFVLLGMAVLAVGATRIDPRRGWGSAFSALLLFSLLFASVFAFFQ